MANNDDDSEQRFSIGMASDQDNPGQFALHVVIKGIPSEEEARTFADHVAKWLTDPSGWFEKVDDEKIH
jgi:hypothetical protein